MRQPRRVILITAVWLAMVAAPVFGLSMVIGEALRRDAILAHGARGWATVEGHRYGKSRTGSIVCTALFGFTLGGRHYRGEWRDCPPGSAEGSRVRIAYDPAEPAGAFVLAEGRWRSGDAGSFVVLAVIFVVVTAGYVSFLTDYPRRKSR